MNIRTKQHIRCSSKGPKVIGQGYVELTTPDDAGICLESSLDQTWAQRLEYPRRVTARASGPLGASPCAKGIGKSSKDCDSAC